MSRKEYGLAFFERYLSQDLRELVDLTKLQLCESKHISDEGISLYNDVLYRCPAIKGQTAYLYAVCEHQSTPSSHMPLRLLEYNVSIIRDHLKQGYATYPLFANFVLYHGADPWNYSVNFTDYYADPVQGAKRLYFAPFTLLNLSHQTDEEVSKDTTFGFQFQALKCTSKPDPFKAFEEAMDRPDFRQHFQQLSIELRSLTLRYLGLYVDQKRHSLKDLVNLAAHNPQEKDNIMTSIAQSYMQQALQQGRQEGILAVARKLLAKGMAPTLISEATGLNLQEIAKIK